MKRGITRLSALALAGGLFILCEAITPPKTGKLVVTLSWQEVDTSAVSAAETPFRIRRPSGKPKSFKTEKNLPGAALIGQRVSRIRFMLEPDEISKEFDYQENGVYTLELPLAFYNVHAEASDAGGTVLYLGDTTRILVEPPDDVELDLAMVPNQPVTAPEFTGLNDINYTVLDTFHLAWSSVERAYSYRLEESLDEVFSSPGTAYNGPDTTLSVSGKPDSTYYYRVRTEGVIGVSRWSGTVAWVVDRDMTLELLTETLPMGAIDVAYDQSLSAQGGSSDYTWSLAEGSLPSGLELEDQGTSGRITGTPTAMGTYDFVVRIEDNRYIGLADTQSYTLQILDVLPLYISQSYLPAATGGQPYSTQLQAEGGVEPYKWSIIDSDPDWITEGMTLTEDGVFSGTVPNWTCTTHIRFRVKDSSSPRQSDTRNLTWIIKPGPITLFDYHFDDGTAGVVYSGSIFYEGGTPPYQSPWTIGGSLPPGLSFTYYDYNMAAGLTGTPTTAGTYNFQITVYDSGSPQKSRTDSFSITINTPMAKPLVKPGEHPK